MSQKYLLAIVIPTYNGMGTLPKTVENIVNQALKLKNEGVFQLVITDDGSTDETRQYLRKIDKKYKIISCFYNRKNLGMDGNFQQAALNAKSEYIWFFGQDDLLKPKTLSSVINVLLNNKLGELYLDFEQYSAKNKKIVCKSVVTTQSRKKLQNGLNIFNSSAEYFKYLSDGPSFLPATIMRKKYILDKRLVNFTGTHYVQYATFLLNLNTSPVGVMNQVLIRGKIPIDGWQTNGSKLFEIAVGKLYAQYLVNRLDKRSLPIVEFDKKKNEFVIRLPKLLLLASYLGMEVKPYSLRALMKIYLLPMFTWKLLINIAKLITWPARLVRP